MALIARRILLATVAGLLVCSQAMGARFNAKNVKPSGLTLAQSKQVLRVVMKHERYKMASPALSIDGPWLTDGKPVVPGYFHFGVIYVTSTQGHYAVNISSGDVWDTESCERYTFPALVAIQKHVAAKTGRALASDDDARTQLGCP